MVRVGHVGLLGCRVEVCPGLWGCEAGMQRVPYCEVVGLWGCRDGDAGMGDGEGVTVGARMRARVRAGVKGAVESDEG